MKDAFIRTGEALDAYVATQQMESLIGSLPGAISGRDITSDPNIDDIHNAVNGSSARS